MHFLAYFTFSISLSLISFLNVKLIQSTLQTLQDQDPEALIYEKLKGSGMLILALVFSGLFAEILNTQNGFMLNLMTQRIQYGINAIIYKKVMRKSMQRDTTFSLGDIVNITSDDSSRISKFASSINLVIIAPL
jgi:ABC-type bacteriocin/lantibiotic exporter with double-glycine peptidase domain